jgi:hypothetical protein
MRTCGARRRSAVRTSRSAAACGLVTMPTVRANSGSARLRSSSNRPSAPSFSFRRWKASYSCADAGAADRLDVDLVVAARAVQGDQGAHLDLVAFARGEAGVLGAAAEHHRAHLGRVVLQREIPVAGRGTGEIRDLAADPYQRKERSSRRATCWLRAVTVRTEGAA